MSPNCLRDEEVLNAPFAPPGPETADLVRMGKTGKSRGNVIVSEMEKNRRRKVDGVTMGAERARV